MTWTATPHRTWRIEFATVGYVVYLTDAGRALPCAYEPDAAQWNAGKVGVKRLVEFSIPSLAVAMNVCRRHAARHKLLTRAEMARLDTAHPHEALAATDWQRKMLDAYEEFHKRMTDMRTGRNASTGANQSVVGKRAARLSRVQVARAGREE